VVAEAEAAEANGGNQSINSQQKPMEAAETKADIPITLTRIT
jgi:hypothetical protein